MSGSGYVRGSILLKQEHALLILVESNLKKTDFYITASNYIKTLTML